MYVEKPYDSYGHMWNTLHALHVENLTAHMTTCEMPYSTACRESH
jgi:hypothetical protein